MPGQLTGGCNTTRRRIPNGDGHASARIGAVIERFLNRAGSRLIMRLVVYALLVFIMRKLAAIRGDTVATYPP
jgi:hypothetical protein